MTQQTAIKTLTLIVNSSIQTIDGLTIPSGHPRIWWNAARIAQAKVWLLSNSFSPSVSDPWGNAFLYVLTGNAIYAQNAITQMMNFTVPANELSGVASDTYRWADWVPVVFDWCHDKLTPSQISTFVARYDSYVVNQEGKGWGGIGMPASNYFWGYFRNELNWGIATYGPDNPNAKTHLDFALTQRWPAFQSYASTMYGAGELGGVTQEGTQYGRTMLQYPTVPFVTCGLLGRDIYRESNFFKESVIWLIYSTTPDNTQLVPFDDIEQGLSAKSYYYEDAMRVAVGEWGSTPVGRYAQQWCDNLGPVTAGSGGAGGGGVGGTVDVWVQSVSTPVSPLSYSNLPLDYYSPGAKYFYLRDNWTAGAMLVFLEMGQEGVGGGHAHNAMGSFQIWNNGKWLAPENPGYSDTWADGTTSDSTQSHNGLVVGGMGIGGAFPLGDTVVSRLSTGSVISYAAVDLTNVYKSNNSNFNNPYVVHIEREFLFIKPMKCLVILDRVNVTTTTIVSQFQMHSPASPVIVGNQATFTISNEKLLLTSLIGSSFTVVNEGTKGQLGQMYRFNVSQSGNTQQYFLNVLQALDVGGPVLSTSVVDNGTSWKINLNNAILGYSTIVFNKGQKTNGGMADYDLSRVPITSTPLRTTVQSISVSDNGPYWGV